MVEMPPGSLDDGLKLEAAWYDALNSSLSYFKALLASSSSSSWRPVQVLPLTASTTARDSGHSVAKGSSVGSISASDVVVHRRKGRTGEVFRAVVEVDCGPDVGLDTFRGCLATPETRPLWDRMVETATTVDLLDAQTRITKTDYRLGWPASPRDAVTITKTLVDQSTLIDISTSVPRSRHEAPYLRPSPPHVRADVALLAWCVQLAGHGSDVPSGRARVTCMWSWDPKGSWAVGGGVPQHLPSVVVGLVDYVRDGSDRIPVLRSYGPDITVGSINYDTNRVTLSVGYAILGATESASSRQIEFGVSSTQGWDVQIKAKSQNGDTPSNAWTSFVGQMMAAAPNQAAPKRLVLRFTHAPLATSEEMVRATVSIERTSSTLGGIRINGIPMAIEPMDRPAIRRPILEDTASGSAISLRTISTVDTQANGVHREKEGRSQASEKAIAGLIKRNYIYFTSLLQEPEPKWRPVLDSRGVAVHQLNSIDKTLVVFRAEAVLVGVGIWDIFSVICNPGSRIVWDRSHDEASLLEDVNELTDLWYTKSKAAWPVAPRDSVMLRTIYKSPSSVHVFGFSTDDTDLFPRIPPSIDPTVIRTQIDLQGWSIESLSPNTTQVTLLEQSDPRGWSNKSSIPQVMMSTLAGMGDFAIKHGAPPIATRLGGAKAVLSRYDLERETFRLEYQAEESRRSGSSGTSTAFPLPVAVRDPKDTGSLKSLDVRKPISNIECEIRCDADKWATNFSILIDPPQAGVSALKRHRLSPAGGGLWLTIEHDAIGLGSEKVSITIRRGTSLPASKTTVTVNGVKIKIDVSDLSEGDVQLLKKQKRGRPSRAPLDQPAALGTLRKKQSNNDVHSSGASNVDPFRTVTPSNYTRFALPLARMYNAAAETTRAAVVPMAIPAPAGAAGATPVDAAIRALAQLSRIHADRESESTDPFGWQPVSDRDGLKIEKRIVSHVSDTFPVYRAGRIIEGFTAEEVSATVSSLRKDERFDKPVILQSHGHGITTVQVTAHTTFPFRSRNLLVATVVARAPDGPPPSPSVSSHPALSTIFHASSSAFDTATIDFEASKYNPTSNTTGKVIIEGWIIETIDPYSHEQYAIPSTRCMYVGSVDYSGNMPLSVNNMLNSSLPRSILVVEQSLRYLGAPSRVRLPPMCVSVPDAAAQGPWSLQGVDSARVGVDQRRDGVDYTMLVTLQPSSKSNERLSPGLRHNDSRSSFHSGRSTIVDLGEEIRRGKQDLVVMEVDIGIGMVRSGCEIMLRAVSLPAAQNLASDGLLPLKLPAPDIDLPLRCSVIALAPSVLQSASLDPATQARQMLRVTLPTSGYEAPVSDPLTGKTGPSPRPRWLLDLINDGAAVEVRLKPKLVGPPKYTYAGKDVAVEDERKKSGSAPSRILIPQLVNRDHQDSVSLDKPLAVAREYMTIPPPLSRPETRASVSSEVPSQAETPVEAEPKSPTDTIRPELPDPPPSRSRYNFWKYSRLRPFSNPVSVDSSPLKSTVQPVLPLAPESDTTSPQPTLTAIDIIRQPLIPIPAFVVACLACLLIGSLLRSLLVDADFVIYLPAGVEMPPGTSWREMRRLGEWPIWPGRDLVLAIARRAG